MSWEVFQGKGRHADRGPAFTISGRLDVLINANGARSTTLRVGEYVAVLYDRNARAVAFCRSTATEGWKVRHNGKGTGLVIQCKAFVRHHLGAGAVGRYPMNRYEHDGELVDGFALGERLP